MLAPDHFLQSTFRKARWTHCKAFSYNLHFQDLKAREAEDHFLLVHYKAPPAAQCSVYTQQNAYLQNS